MSSKYKLIKKVVALWVLVALFLSSGVNLSVYAAAATVTFADKNFEAEVRKIIKKPSGQILKSDVEKIKEMDIYDAGVKSVEGIGNFTNLEILNFGQNNISDIKPLAGLKKLKKLYLWKNSITDISPLKNFTNLEELSIFENKVKDISILKGMKKLKLLYISKNPIKDLSPVMGIYKQLREKDFQLKNGKLVLDTPAEETAVPEFMKMSLLEEAFDIQAKVKNDIKAGKSTGILGSKVMSNKVMHTTRINNSLYPGVTCYGDKDPSKLLDTSRAYYRGEYDFSANTEDIMIGYINEDSLRDIDLDGFIKRLANPEITREQAEVAYKSVISREAWRTAFAIVYDKTPDPNDGNKVYGRYVIPFNLSPLKVFDFTMKSSKEYRKDLLMDNNVLFEFEYSQGILVRIKGKYWSLIHSVGKLTTLTIFDTAKKYNKTYKWEDITVWAKDSVVEKNKLVGAIRSSIVSAGRFIGSNMEYYFE